MTPITKRLLVSMAFLAFSSPALAAGAVTGNPTLTSAGAWNVGAFGALDIPTFSGSGVGPRGGAEALYGIGRIGEGLYLDVGPRAAIAYDVGAVDVFPFEILAAGRLSYAATPKLALYGEAGFGIGIYHASTTGASDSGSYFSMLFAPGFIYALNSRMNLLGEVGFWINAKSGLGTHVAVPTVGVQWKL
jgi:hypothetical protein